MFTSAVGVWTPAAELQSLVLVSAVSGEGCPRLLASCWLSHSELIGAMVGPDSISSVLVCQWKEPAGMFILSDWTLPVTHSVTHYSLLMKLLSAGKHVHSKCNK